GPAKDRDLLLELPDTAARRAELGRFLTASSRPAAVVDIVLSQPVVEGDLVDAQVQCRLLDLAALADQSDGAGTELGRVRAGHAQRLPRGPSTRGRRSWRWRHVRGRGWLGADQRRRYAADGLFYVCQAVVGVAWSASRVR